MIFLSLRRINHFFVRTSTISSIGRLVQYVRQSQSAFPCRVRKRGRGHGGTCGETASRGTRRRAARRVPRNTGAGLDAADTERACDADGTVSCESAAENWWCLVGCRSGASTDPGRLRRVGVPGPHGPADRRIAVRGSGTGTEPTKAQSRREDARRRPSHAFRSLPPRYPGTMLSTLRGVMPSLSRSLLEQTLSTFVER